LDEALEAAEALGYDDFESLPEPDLQDGLSKVN